MTPLTLSFGYYSNTPAVNLFIEINPTMFDEIHQVETILNTQLRDMMQVGMTYGLSQSRHKAGIRTKCWIIQCNGLQDVMRAVAAFSSKYSLYYKNE